MINYIAYTLEVSVCMLIFYLTWRLLLKKETFNKLNRIYLISSFLLSFIIPALNINYSISGNTSMAVNYIDSITLEEIVVSSNSNTLHLIDWVAITYATIVSFLFIRFIGRIIQIRRIVRNSTSDIYKGRKIFITEKEISPFSFNNMIFFNKLDIGRKDFDEIFQHELTHVKQRHSIDIILSEIAGIFQWFNPMIYVYKKHLKMLHEYLSDEKVILQGFEPGEYQMLLIERQIGKQLKFANYFNKSLTLKRIQMIKKDKSRNKAKLKLLAVLPILLLTVSLFSFTGKSYTSSEATVISPQDTIYTVVDEEAKYPGGKMEMRKFLATNVKYPVEARKKGEQGTVFVKFIVYKNGEVGKPTILKGVSESLDKESIRVVKLLPNFEKPAYNDGKPVDVYYTAPITYKLK